VKHILLTQKEKVIKGREKHLPIPRRRWLEGAKQKVHFEIMHEGDIKIFVDSTSH
jgi:hypothetical protein